MNFSDIKEKNRPCTTHGEKIHWWCFTLCWESCVRVRVGETQVTQPGRFVSCSKELFRGVERPRSAGFCAAETQQGLPKHLKTSPH